MIQLQLLKNYYTPLLVTDIVVIGYRKKSQRAELTTAHKAGKISWFSPELDYLNQDLY